MPKIPFSAYEKNTKSVIAFDKSAVIFEYRDFAVDTEVKTTEGYKMQN